MLRSNYFLKLLVYKTINDALGLQVVCFYSQPPWPRLNRIRDGFLGRIMTKPDLHTGESRAAAYLERGEPLAERLPLIKK